MTTNELWEQRAAIAGRDDLDLLRRVIDPSDTAGVKNTYLDRYTKHYLLTHLDPQPTDVVLEVGCGIGRLVEFIAPHVAHAYGTDIIDAFVQTGRTAPHRAPNAHYLLASESDELARARVNKLYIVWMLLCIESDAAVVELLRSYRERLPALRCAVILDQVKRSPENESLDGRFYCRYRTIAGFRELFERAGFAVRAHAIMPERSVGPLYRILRLTYRMLPRALAGSGARLFAADRRFNAGRAFPDSRVGVRIPTDVAFELSVP